MLVGIVSDIHCQAGALAVALERMGPIDRLFALGDIIDQSRFSAEVVRTLRARDAVVLRGNHDESFLCGPGAAARRAAVAEQDDLTWLETRPDRAALTLEGKRLLLVHSTPWPSDHAYVTPAHPLFPRFAEADADIVLYGHTHEPVVRRLGGMLVVNPGSIGHGRPTDTGFVRSFALLDLPKGEARIVDLD
ncbi:metallophosphoesterase family protein [Sphingomonas sp. CGMCC 1.13654]|uniref:Phosphoesterase n=1 Tax=Sphingomonas chungangi TaxID=2683589 RepID=A0A838L569_9SPHN|nr:metallophosphoesterase family protein [Sphingomonas chungangi]MBA2933742.1 metallophosphoesterase family protein [Sphingomonas chungangi]